MDAELKGEMLAEMAEAQVFLGNLYGALSTIRYALVLGYSAFPFFMTLCRIAGMLGRIADARTVNEALDLAERTSAEHLLKEIKENAQRSGTTRSIELAWLTFLAEAQATGGRREKADHTLQTALNLVSSDDYDIVGRQEVIDSGYFGIVRVQARIIGDIPGALKTLERIKDRRFIDLSMSHIAGALVEAGDLSGAFAFVARIDEDKTKTNTLIGIAYIQARHGDIVEAKNTLAHIDLLAADSKAEALIEIADIQARQGDSGGAKNTLACIERSVDGTARCECADGLLRIAMAEIQRGDRESARRSLTESLHIVDEAQLTPFRIAELYVALGMVENAQRIFKRIPPDRDLLARMIAKAHTVAGNVTAAEAWIPTLPSASEQCFAWLGIVDGFASLSQKSEGTG
jgi:thioredoxin-like negative regulator of GroEL